MSYMDYARGFEDGQRLSAVNVTAPFLVFNSTKGGAPTYRHPTRAAAEGEARRLANLNPGEDFYVVGSVSVSKAPKLNSVTRALV